VRLWTTIATQEELQDAKVDPQNRDFCAHLLLPLAGGLLRTLTRVCAQQGTTYLGVVAHRGSLGTTRNARRHHSPSGCNGECYLGVIENKISNAPRGTTDLQGGCS